jgi:hypothetical protein
MIQRLGVSGVDVAAVAASVLTAWNGGHDGIFEDALRGVDELSRRRRNLDRMRRPFDALEAERLEALESAVESLREHRAIQAEIRAAVHILEHLANPPLCLVTLPRSGVLKPGVFDQESPTRSGAYNLSSEAGLAV